MKTALKNIKEAMNDNKRYASYTSDHTMLVKKVREIEYFKQPDSDWFGMNKDEKAKEIQDILKNFMSAVKDGDIIHVEYTGDEFLRYKINDQYHYSYIYNGPVSNWKGQEGVTLEENGEYPDSVGGLGESNLYVQPNNEVHSPLDEFEGWENDWEIMSETAFRKINA